MCFCLFGFQNLEAQTTVSGIVTDAANGLPISGANVTIKGTKNGVSTGFDGKYSIKSPNSSAILVISYIGFITKEVAVSDETTINVALAESPNQLGEVVVTALGISKDQRKVGYAVATVGGDNLNKARETNVANSLSGSCFWVLW